MKITISKTLATRFKLVCAELENEVQATVLPKLDPKTMEPITDGIFGCMKVTVVDDEVTIYIPEDIVFEYVDAYLNVLKRIVKIFVVVHKSGLLDGLKEDFNKLKIALKGFYKS